VLLNENFDSLESYQQAHAGWDIQFQQLEVGKLCAHSLQVAGNSTILTRTSLDRRIHQQGASPPGMLTFGILLKPGSELNWCGRRATPETLECFEASGGFDTVSQGDFDVLTMAIAMDRVIELQEVHEIRTPMDLEKPDARVFLLRPGDAARFRQSCSRLVRSLEGPGSPRYLASATSLMEETLPTALLGAVADESVQHRKPCPPVRRRAREQAVAYMRAHASDAPNIAALCRRIGVSWRLLDYAFKDYYGVTPKAYLNMLRLDGLRSDLLRAGPEATVTDLAGEWGFGHFGQLSVDYRKRFGERPSDTLNSPSRQ
jgi:AraC family ethanolamine operon transcriptional activator